jgi:uncharacterized protein
MRQTHSNPYLPEALEGRSLQNIFIVDSHVHTGYWPLMHVARPAWPDTLQSMDRIGINVAIVNGVLNPDYRQGNDEVGNLVKKYPGRVLGAVAVNPFYQQDLHKEMARCVDGLGFRGIKIHELVTKQAFSYSYEPRLLGPILEFAEDRNCPILFHGLISEAMIREHPRINFICAHGPANINLSLSLARYENFFVDTAYSIVLAGTFELLVDKLGAHRILFGSDAPLSSPAIRLGQVLSARLSDAAVRQILGLNASRLYGIEVP